MTQQQRAPEPKGNDWQAWGRRLMIFLGQTRSALVQQTGGETAAEDGIIMWDRTKKYVVVSSASAFRQVATQQAAPASSVGAAGDVANMIAWDTNYIYICTGSHDGSTAIWKRVALSTF
jgi:hypothetical protein